MKNRIFAICLLLLCCLVYAISITPNDSEQSYSLRNKISMSCSTPPATVATITCVQNGNWNSPATWSTNSVPLPTDDVEIGMGFTVTLSGTITTNSIMVMGTLRPATSTTNFTVTTKGIMVSGGLLEIGTPSNPYTGIGNFILTGTTTTEVLFPGMTAMGTKLIGAMNGGTIRMQGIDKKSWTQLNVNATTGNTQITLKEPVNWFVGDQIVIVSSRLDWNEAEKRTITAVSSDAKTISFSQPLVYPHSGTKASYIRATDTKVWTADIRAEVGLLSHNIKIQGDAASATNGFGGHVMIHYNGFAYIDGVELYQMGQKSKKGRYPFHWHMLANTGAGQYFKNSSVNVSYNRALTIHGTSSTTVENNFFYYQIGHGIFLEDGSETNNLIKGNVVLLTTKPLPGEEITPSDNQFSEPQNQTPSSYWITNPNNTFINNVAAGTQGTGFWYALAQNFMFDSATDPRFTSNTKPFKEIFGGFDGNTAHSCMNGFDIFDQLDANHSILKNLGWDEPNLKYFNNCTWYANNIGIYSGIGDSRASSSKVIFNNNAFVENRIALMLASFISIDESVFVANSGQSLISGERFLYRVYDGAGTIKNSYLVGWNADNSNLVTNIGASTKHANHTFENITTDHTGTIRAAATNVSQPQTGYIDVNSAAHPRVWSLIFYDKTGSLSGTPNSSIIANHPFLVVGDETQRSNWSNIVSSTRRYCHTIQYYNMSGDLNPNVSVKRTKTNTPTASVYYIYGYKENHQVPIIVNDNFLYTYQYETLPSTKYVRQIVQDASVGDSYISRYKDFGKLGGLTLTASAGPFASYSSLNTLQNAVSSGYYKEPNGDLYIKSVSVQNDQFYVITWTTNFTVPVLDTDGDGYVDATEATTNRFPTDATDLNFSFITGTDNWASSGTIASTCVACSGALQINTNGSNALITRANLNFDATKVPFLNADVSSSLAGNFKLYWTTENEAAFSEDKSVTTSYTTAGVRKLMSFALNSNPKWSGQTIMSLKLVLPIGTATTKVYSIAGANNDADGDGISNSDEQLLCRDYQNATDFSINFDAAYDATSTWNYGSISNFTVANGTVSGTSLGDAQFYKSPNLNFNGSTVPKLVMKMKASTNATVQLFWQNEDGPFAASRSSTKNYTNNGAWQELTFDLSANTNWIGKTIKNLRIDPVQTGSISFEIDWIHALNYSDCSCETQTVVQALTTVNNWTYYGKTGTTDYLFAIEHQPAGGNTVPFTASVVLSKNCDLTTNVYKISDLATKEGLFIAGYYWNITMISGTTNGFVNVRFFPDATFNNSLQMAADAFQVQSNSNYKSPILYFKTNNALLLPNDIRADGKGLNYGFSPLPVNSTGTYASKNYVQFNAVSSSNNSGGGVLIKVTNLNENNFMSTSQALEMKGSLRYNPSNDKFEGFNGYVWTPLH